MSPRHKKSLVAECPNSGGLFDASVEEEQEVTCHECLKMLASSGSSADGGNGERESEYLQGYDDGREAAYAEIVVCLDGAGHHDACICDPCCVIRAVWHKSLSTALQLRLDEWIRVNRN